MRYIQRLNQRCKQRQWDILQRLYKDVNKGNEIYTKAKQRCKQRQWDITKAKQRCKQRQWDINKG